MSERGSFVTEYVYCEKCFEAAKKVLLSRNKTICSTVIPHWNPEGEGPEMPIIAGKVGGSYSGQELFMFETEIVQDLSKVICHPMRVGVLAECGEQIFTVMPNCVKRDTSVVDEERALSKKQDMK